MSQSPKNKDYARRLLDIMNDFVHTATEAVVSVVPQEQREQAVSAARATAEEARRRAASVIGEASQALNRLSGAVRPPAKKRPARAKKASSKPRAGARKAKRRGKRA